MAKSHSKDSQHKLDRFGTRFSSNVIAHDNCAAEFAQERTVKGVVSQMSAHEVYDVVSNMKQMVEKEPDKAKQMFVSHPQVRTHDLLRSLDLQSSHRFPAV